MTLTNAQIFDSLQALTQAKDEKGLLGYAVAVNLRKLGQLPEYVEFARQRDELLAAHGTPAGDGKYNLTPQAAAAFYKALEPLAAVEAEVNVMQVPLSVFCGGGLTAGQMYDLDWMKKEE